MWRVRVVKTLAITARNHLLSPNRLSSIPAISVWFSSSTLSTTLGELFDGLKEEDVHIEAASELQRTSISSRRSHFPQCYAAGVIPDSHRPANRQHEVSWSGHVVHFGASWRRWVDVKKNRHGEPFPNNAANDNEVGFGIFILFTCPSCSWRWWQSRAYDVSTLQLESNHGIDRSEWDISLPYNRITICTPIL